MWRRLIPLVAFALVACADRPEVDVHMVHAPTLVPASAFETLSVRVLRAEDGSLAHETVLEARTLMGQRAIDDLSLLPLGETFVVEIAADAPGTCRLGRAVGRSLPFEHRAEDYRVPVHVGCADEIFGLPPLNHPRLAHSLVPTDDGGAFVGGGAQGAVSASGIPAFVDFTRIVERYDPGEGRFVTAGGLSVERAGAAGVATPDGAAWVGGTVPGGAPACTTSVEISIGASTSPGANLAEARCLPSALRLPDADAVLVVGSPLDATDRDADIEVLSGDLRTRVSRGHADARYRIRPELVPLADGTSALVLGGSRLALDAAPQRVSLCPSGACVESVANDGLPTGGWREMAATHVACAAGGGAVYAVGGMITVGGTDRVIDSIFCARDGATLGPFRQVGTLPSGRRGHRMVAVRGSRLLVVGGIDEGGDPLLDALLIEADGCTCDPVGLDAIESLPVPVRGVLLNHDLRVLADGAVLLVGGLTVRSMMEQLVFTATGEAALFIPDFDE